MRRLRIPNSSSKIFNLIVGLFAIVLSLQVVVLSISDNFTQKRSGTASTRSNSMVQYSNVYSSISIHNTSFYQDGSSTSSSPAPSSTASSSYLGSPSVKVVPGDSQVKISWLPPTKIIFGTEVDESLDAGINWVPVVKLPPTFTHEAVQNLTNGQNYWFRVRWILVDGTFGIPSPTMVSSPIANPAQPTGLSVIPGDGEAALSWDPPIIDNSITGYEVDASIDGEATWKVISANTGSSGSGYLATKLVNGKTYGFRIRALAFSGVDSGYSSSATAKIGAIKTKGFALTYIAKPPKITLAWETPADLPDVQTYQVNVSGDGGLNWFPIASTAGGVNTVVVPYVIGGSSYQVLATSGEGNTALSEIQLVETNVVPDATSTAQPGSSTGASGSPSPSSPATPTPSASPTSSASPSPATGGSLPIIPIAVGLVVIIGLVLLVVKSRKSKGKKKPVKRKPVKRKPVKRKPIKKRAFPPKPIAGVGRVPTKKPKKKIKKKPAKKLKKKVVSEKVKAKKAAKRKVVNEKARKKREKRKSKALKKQKKNTGKTK